MIKSKIFNFGVFIWFFILVFFLFCQAEDANQNVGVQEEKIQEPQIIPEKADASTVTSKALSSDNITLDFSEADIKNVLKIISYKAGVNIVTTPDVIGNITIRMTDVPWERALDVILKTYGFAYDRQANVILVTKLENINKIQSEEPLRTEIFSLKFLDASDAQRAIIPMLSPRGKVSILYARGQKGWQFGTFKIGKDMAASGQMEAAEKGVTSRPETVSIEKNAEGRTIATKVDFEQSVKSKTLFVTDTTSSLDKIRNFVNFIDKKPKQVLIETRIMEINVDRLRDIGVDWGTGSGGANAYATAPTDLSLGKKGKKSLAGRNLASEFTPGAFSPKEGTTTFPGTYPYKAGLELIFKKLGGTQFEIILHALEEDVHTNTLSAPRILTLDNQEASILVGFHTPILSSTVTAASTSTGPTLSQTLDYYQEIGIRLNVVPQVSDEGYINMIIHPSVTSSSSNVTATNIAGTGTSAITSTIDYPIIDVREAQTQVIMKDGETIVIGGLIKDVISKETIGIPFLMKLPWIGKAFQRETIDKSKVDLLIFITAHVVKDEQLSAEEISRLQQKMALGEPNTVAVKIDQFPSKAAIKP